MGEVKRRVETKYQIRNKKSLDQLVEAFLFFEVEIYRA